MFKLLKRSVLALTAVVLLVGPPAVSGSNLAECSGGTCTCTGDADCNDMFSKGVCSDLAYCTKDSAGRVFCECLARQGPATAASKSKRIPYSVVAIDRQAGKVTVQQTPNSARVRIPLSAALLSHVKAGDKVFVSPTSSLVRNGTLIGEAVAAKKTPEECDKCKSDCLDKVSGKYHVVTKNGKQQGDSGWEAAFRSCVSENGCVTGKDCP